MWHFVDQLMQRPEKLPKYLTYVLFHYGCHLLVHSLVFTSYFDLPCCPVTWKYLLWVYIVYLSISFNHICEQSNLRFPARLDYSLFQICCQITVSTDAGLTGHTESGSADNKYCFSPVLLWIFNFSYCSDPSYRHASGRPSCSIVHC